MHSRRLLLATVVVAAAAAGLAGCASSGGYSRAAEPAIPAGSAVIVEQALTVSGGRARVYLQGGETIRYQDRERFEPWCSIGLDRQVETGQSAKIARGRFEAGQPYHGVRADAGSVSGVKLASRAGGGYARASFDRGGPATLTHFVEVPLKSSAQPSVRQLRCAIDRDTDWRGRITTAFVRNALGSRVRVELPER